MKSNNHNEDSNSIIRYVKLNLKELKCIFHENDYVFGKEKVSLNLIKDHYVKEHNINQESNVFQLYLKSLINDVEKITTLCPACGDIFYTNYELYTHVFAKHYELSELDFTHNNIRFTKSEHASLPEKTVYQYGLYEEHEQSSGYDFKDVKLMDVIVNYATYMNLQYFLKNNDSYENYEFSAYVIFQLLNLNLKTEEIIYKPFIRTTSIISGRVLDDDFINSLISTSKKYIFMGDDRGSGYQFFKYVSISVVFRNRKNQYVRHFFGGKVNKHKQIKNDIVNTTDTNDSSDSSDSDDKIKKMLVDKFTDLIGEILKIKKRKKRKRKRKESNTLSMQKNVSHNEDDISKIPEKVKRKRKKQNTNSITLSSKNVNSTKISKKYKRNIFTDKLIGVSNKKAKKEVFERNDECDKVIPALNLITNEKTKNEGLSCMDDLYEHQSYDINFSDDCIEISDDDNRYNMEYVFIDKQCDECINENKTSDAQVVCNHFVNLNLKEHIDEDCNATNFHDNLPTIEENEDNSLEIDDIEKENDTFILPEDYQLNKKDNVNECDETDSDDDDNDKSVCVYECRNTVSLISLQKMLEKRTMCGKDDNRGLSYTPNQIVNDLPEEYLNISINESEKIREKYLSAYNVTPAKFKAIEKTLEKNMLSVCTQFDGTCVLDCLKDAMLKKLGLLNQNLGVCTPESHSALLSQKFTDVLQTYQNTLTFIKLKDYATLVDFAKVLVSETNVIFNIFQYSSKYITRPIILKTDYKELDVINSIPVSYLYPVFIGVDEIGAEQMKKNKIKHVLNLVYNVDEINNDNLEIEMRYIIELSEFYKCIDLNKHKIEPGKSLKNYEYIGYSENDYTLRKVYPCDKCLDIWSTKRKKRFEEHTKICVGKYTIPITISSDLYTFVNHSAATNLPYTIYYDYETTCLGPFMIPISYSIYVSVNRKYISVEKGENITTYNHILSKSVWMTHDQLADLNLPDFLKPYMNNDFTVKMNEYAQLVVDNPIDKYIETINKSMKAADTSNVVQRDYAILDLWQIELTILNTLYDEYFYKIRRSNSELPRSIVVKYHKEHVIEDEKGKEIYGKCFVCDFPVEKQLSKEKFKLIHEDAISHEARKMYNRLHMNVEDSGASTNILFSEESFVNCVLKSIRIVSQIFKKIKQDEMVMIYNDSLNDQISNYDIIVTDFDKSSIIYKYFNRSDTAPDGVNNFTSLFRYIRTKYIVFNDKKLSSPIEYLLMHDISRRVASMWYNINKNHRHPNITLEFIMIIIKWLLHVQPVLDHDHYNFNPKTNINGYCHSCCNSTMQNNKGSKNKQYFKQKKVPCFAHNAGKFDNNFSMTQLKPELLGTGPDGISLRGKSVNNIKNIKISKFNTVLQDSFSFCAESLDRMVAKADKEVINDMKLAFNDYLMRSSIFRYRWMNLSKNDQKDILDLLVSKGVFPYEIFTNDAAGKIEKFPIRTMYGSILRNKASIPEDDYLRGEEIYKRLGLRNLSELLTLYNAQDVIQLNTVMEKFFDENHEITKLNPRMFSSMSQFSSVASLRESKAIITGPRSVELSESIESSIKGGYADSPSRLSFDNRMFEKEDNSGNTVEKRLLKIKVKPLEENSINDTDNDKKEEEKVIFSTTVITDQVSQYATEMTRNLIVGQYKKISCNEPPNGFDDWESWIKQYDFDTSDMGYFFEVILEPPTDMSQASTRSTELFNPVLVKHEPRIQEVSPYQLIRKRERSGIRSKKSSTSNEINYKKIRFETSTLCRMDRIKENIFGQLLQYVLRDLDFKLIAILELHTFKQVPWLRDYIISNQERRKSYLAQNNTVGSNSEKLKNNTCFGGHSVSSNGVRLSVIYDYVQESEKYKKAHPDCTDIDNPWLRSDEQITENYRVKFKAEQDKLITKLNEGKINREQYEDSIMLIKERMASNIRNHKNAVSKTHMRKNVEVKNVVDEMQSAKNYKDIYINQSPTAGIKAIVAHSPKNTTVIGRAIGSMILQLAKRDISNYITRVVRLFHQSTRPKEVDIYLKNNLINEIHVYLCATDTDSAKMQILAVADKDTKLNADSFSLNIRKLICIHLKDILDLSDDYFKRFNLCDKSTRKKLGVFGFDEISDVSTVLPEDQVKYGMYLGPKKYYEESLSKNVKMKHAGTSRRSEQVNAADYAKDMNSFSYVYNRLKEYESLLDSTDKDEINTIQNPTAARRIVQNTFKKNKNGTKLSESMKVVFSSISFKRYILGDGINTLPYGHSLLKKYVNILNDKQYQHNTYQQDTLMLKKIENEKQIYLHHRPLYIQKQLLSTGVIERNKYDVTFLEAITQLKY